MTIFYAALALSTVFLLAAVLLITMAPEMPHE